jgi:hypothetical protein
MNTNHEKTYTNKITSFVSRVVSDKVHEVSSKTQLFNMPKAEAFQKVETILLRSAISLSLRREKQAKLICMIFPSSEQLLHIPSQD